MNRYLVVMISLLLGGCSFDAYQHPQIYWPESWEVDDHAKKDAINDHVL